MLPQPLLWTDLQLSKLFSRGNQLCQIAFAVFPCTG
jgi:hypothetical protein